MIPYRIYILDDTDHIADVIETDCANDQEALAAAQRMSEPSALVEVWQFARCLGKVRSGGES
jgi:hypothetical protein